MTHQSQPSWIVAQKRFCADGPEIRYAYLPPLDNVIQGLVVFINGHNDWIEKYDFLPDLLGIPPGWGFLTWDHRGQGASAGMRSYIDSYDQFATDTQSIIRSFYEGENLLVIAHSMGGLIALYTMLKGWIKPRALVLCSPLLALPNHPLPRLIYRPICFILAHTPWRRLYAGKFCHKPFAENDKTQSESAYMKIIGTPFSAHKPTFAWLNATFRATCFINRKWELASRLCPVLLLTGSFEKIVDFHGFERWYRRALKLRKSISMITIPKAKHEILNEETNIQSYAAAAVVDFLMPYFTRGKRIGDNGPFTMPNRPESK